MKLERPDLTGVDAAIVAYIEALEAELASGASSRELATPIPAEAATTEGVITLTASVAAKRTYRHLYERQRRGGMGVFGLETGETDPPAHIATLGEELGLVLVTDQGRGFRIGPAELPTAPLYARPIPLRSRLGMRSDEQVSLVFPDQGDTYLVLVTARGQVRRIRYHYLGENVKPGSILHDIKEGGPPVAACWSGGDSELFIATRKGNGIRFSERQVPVRGILGIRVDPDDRVVGIAPVAPDGGVFLMSADGKGTIRLMAGFAMNKEPGGGGKIAMKTECLAGAAPLRGVGEQTGAEDDIFAVSRLGKVIRFPAREVPAKEGVVQGVNCMALRADVVVGVASARVPGLATNGASPTADED